MKIGSYCADLTVPSDANTLVAKAKGGRPWEVIQIVPQKGGQRWLLGSSQEHDFTSVVLFDHLLQYTRYYPATRPPCWPLLSMATSADCRMHTLKSLLPGIVPRTSFDLASSVPVFVALLLLALPFE